MASWAKGDPNMPAWLREWGEAGYPPPIWEGPCTGGCGKHVRTGFDQPDADAINWRNRPWCWECYSRETGTKAASNGLNAIVEMVNRKLYD